MAISCHHYYSLQHSHLGKMVDDFSFLISLYSMTQILMPSALAYYSQVLSSNREQWQ